MCLFTRNDTQNRGSGLHRSGSVAVQFIAARQSYVISIC
jgi:hypothetical protein